MRQKLLQIEEPLASLKGRLLEQARRSLLSELRSGPLSERRFAEHKSDLEGLLSRGEFADVAVHLTALAVPPPLGLVEETLARARPHHLFLEERLPSQERSPAWERLVSELTRRLELDVLETILKRKPVTQKRKAYVARRLRRNVAEYCTVVKVPLTPEDTFTPFMLPRIEAVVASCLRFLSRYR